MTAIIITTLAALALLALLGGGIMAAAISALAAGKAMHWLLGEPQRSSSAQQQLQEIDALLAQSEQTQRELQALLDKYQAKH